MYSAYKTEPGIRPFPTYVFVDLENLAFLAEGLQPLSLACRTQGITFRAYCSPSHTQADRATHLSQSSEKEAADVRMTCDAAILSSFYSETDILLVTDDLWGKTLAAELKAVMHATYDGRLPPVWRARFGGEATISGYLAAFDIHRQRRDRTPSVAGPVAQDRGPHGRGPGTGHREGAVFRMFLTAATRMAHLRLVLGILQT